MAKIGRLTNLTKFTLRKRKVQEELQEVCNFLKNRESNKNFSCFVGRFSNKYSKNSKNNILNKILDLEREKVRRLRLFW